MIAIDTQKLPYYSSKVNVQFSLFYTSRSLTFISSQ
jgi:hypothetical protein